MNKAHLDRYIIAIFMIAMIFCCSCSHISKDIGKKLIPHPEPFTKGDWIAAGYFIAGHTSDFISTERMLNNPNNHEINLVLGKHPTDTEIAIYFVSTAGAALLIGWMYPEIRKYLFYSYGTLNFGLAIHNEQLD